MAVRLAASLAAVARLTATVSRRSSEPPGQEPWTAGVAGWDRPARAPAGSDEVSVPIVVGWLRPAIVVPQPLLGRAKPEPDRRGAPARAGARPAGGLRLEPGAQARADRLLAAPLVWLVGRLIGRGPRAGVRRPVRPRSGRCGRVPGLAARGRLRPGPPARARRWGWRWRRTTNLGRRLEWIDRTRAHRAACCAGRRGWPSPCRSWPRPACSARSSWPGWNRKPRSSRRLRAGRDTTGHSAAGHRDRGHRQGYGQATGRGESPNLHGLRRDSSGRPIARGDSGSTCRGSRSGTTSASTSGPTATCSSVTPSVPSTPRTA